ncbi:hypothetical protein QEG98_09840 [Myxococcus sp. MxC21-1]|uniref:hypothetical protein n=1 Tax=Myxococcus sp. MxC21-1 TaxID=3041439 RepID=UPI0029317ED3|nr:hypothetical protein [Myxococcus sp. MxC21-1]WNZ66187.1 hypothetical protein QEG98_09840 [Myxococcus sp. MxC21-1]
MGNVLSDDKQQQVIALERLGWSPRRIEDATVVRRRTASGYPKAAGVGIRPPRRWGKSKPANDSAAQKDEGRGNWSAGDTQLPEMGADSDTRPSPPELFNQPGQSPPRRVLAHQQ